MTSFYICLEKEGATSPFSHPQTPIQGTGGATRLWRSCLPVWEAAATTKFGSIQKSPAQPVWQQRLSLETTSLEHQLEKRFQKKKVLKTWKNAANEHRTLQSRKEIHNSWNLAPFHTTDCSMADVKCIYGVGTFPTTSWGLGKISVICLRETCLVGDEKFFFFYIYNSSFHLP